jgi:D-alanyl-D-alanine endopeptidase (penicillin-binding protein 7)
MSLSARRLMMVACLGLVVTWLPAGPAAATPAASRSHGATVRKSSGGKTSAPAKRHRRRARRLPPGGVVWARNAVVVDPATHEVLFEKDATTTVPIASLSKLMTTLLFLEQKPDLDRVVEVTKAEIAGAGRTQLRNHERVSLGDLLHMSLMCSDNCATRVLARESGLEREDFLALMNRKAVDLGLARTRFVEFTGLDERNVSTAADCARLLQAAVAHPTIQQIMTTRSYEFRGEYGRYRPRHAISNTNHLLNGRYEVRGGKTGFILSAGYCFATWIHTQQRDLIAVVLGAPTGATRFADVVRLIQRTTQSDVAPSD